MAEYEAILSDMTAMRQAVQTIPSQADLKVFRQKLPVRDDLSTEFGEWRLPTGRNGRKV